VSARWTAAALMLWMAAAHGAEGPFGVLDIALGMSHARLAYQLDFRDINTALAAAKSGKPDLGKRGYGCMPRDDAFADLACVSHEEKLDAVETREIRLHFLESRLQQFSVTAELRYADAVIGYLRARYGEPREVAASNPDTAPGLLWENESVRVAAYRGKDLVFVNFELAGYAGAVKRKRDGVSLQCN
jgi:hypothetical protein